MKKNLLNAFLLVIFFASMIPQAFALELKVSDNGTVYFYNDSVLGDEKEEEQEKESENEVEQKEEEKETEDEKENEVENEVEHKENEVKEADERKIIRTTVIEDGNIRVGKNDSKIRVDLKKNKQNLKIKESGFNEVESAELERLKIELPAKQSEKQQKKIEARKTKLEKLNQAQNEMAEKLREERKQRVEEKIELRNKQREDGEQELELETRGISATLKNADFEYDQETGLLSVTTENGEVHELNHLPDQAIERIMENRVEDINEDEVEIEVNDDGTTEYKVKATKKTKLFGLIDRNINTQIVLNDNTGEVTETEIENTTALGRLLDRLSF
ncbi:hypothetical protein KA111_00920 [Candidatus Woesebacteria bacterium]|nr:hypothetical protein [Candidatus Woesebacteria bacterium]